MLVDTHTHLNLPPLYDHWREVLDRSESLGVASVIVPGTNLVSSSIAVELAQSDLRIFAAVGIHPHELENKNYDLRSMIQELKILAKNARVVAIGECGLDYYRNTEYVKEQQLLFSQQVELAGSLGLPLIIHTRTTEAMNDAVTILKQASDLSLVFHCFSGDVDFWNLIEPLGAYVGVGATITYPKNDKLREVVKRIPIERIVLETDAPWLPPQSKRGQINEPGNVTISACKLAEIKEIQLSEVLEITGNNVLDLFERMKL